MLETKTIALVVIFGCALAAPTPRVDDPHRAQAINFIPGNDIKELESSLDEMAALFKQSFQKYGIYAKWLLRICNLVSNKEAEAVF